MLVALRLHAHLAINCAVILGKIFGAMHCHGFLRIELVEVASGHLAESLELGGRTNSFDYCCRENCESL
jgi:hypothetical protein